MVYFIRYVCSNATKWSVRYCEGLARLYERRLFLILAERSFEIRKRKNSPSKQPTNKIFAPFFPEGRFLRTLLKRAGAETRTRFARRAIFALRGKNRREIF